MRFCELFKKRRIALLTVIGVCLLCGCGSDKAAVADTDIASAAVTDIITISETAEETVPESSAVTTSETTEETVPESSAVTTFETAEETIPERSTVTTSETTEQTVPETESVTSAEKSNGITYVLNTNTKRIHYTDCASVKKIKPENYDTTDDFDKAIADGFKPCGNCKPHG